MAAVNNSLELSLISLFRARLLIDFCLKDFALSFMDLFQPNGRHPHIDLFALHIGSSSQTATKSLFETSNQLQTCYLPHVI